ncbi:unnamed protein product [Effrenium voratum]|uniref:Uncharacterized protein n=1 Tax=Effrenium voratum TaxID=2562239 RepID=A0AA36I802_9DINO|nr:unnamed protein product [Effrenium voratum]
MGDPELVWLPCKREPTEVSVASDAVSDDAVPQRRKTGFLGHRDAETLQNAESKFWMQQLKCYDDLHACKLMRNRLEMASEESGGPKWHSQPEQRAQEGENDETGGLSASSDSASSSRCLFFVSAVREDGRLVLPNFHPDDVLLDVGYRNTNRDSEDSKERIQGHEELETLIREMPPEGQRALRRMIDKLAGGGSAFPEPASKSSFPKEPARASASGASSSFPKEPARASASGASSSFPKEPARASASGASSRMPGSAAVPGKLARPIPLREQDFARPVPSATREQEIARAKAAAREQDPRSRQTIRVTDLAREQELARAQAAGKKGSGLANAISVSQLESRIWGSVQEGRGKAASQGKGPLEPQKTSFDQGWSGSGAWSTAAALSAQGPRDARHAPPASSKAEPPARTHTISLAEATWQGEDVLTGLARRPQPLVRPGEEPRDPAQPLSPLSVILQGEKMPAASPSWATSGEGDLGMQASPLLQGLPTAFVVDGQMPWDAGQGESRAPLGQPAGLRRPQVPAGESAQLQPSPLMQGLPAVAIGSVAEAAPGAAAAVDPPRPAPKQKPEPERLRQVFVPRLKRTTAQCVVADYEGLPESDSPREQLQAIRKEDPGAVLVAVSAVRLQAQQLYFYFMQQQVLLKGVYVMPESAEGNRAILVLDTAEVADELMQKSHSIHDSAWAEVQVQLLRFQDTDLT